MYVVFSVLSAHFVPKAASESSVILNEATQQSATNPTTIPGFGASNTESAAPVAAPVQTPAPDATPAE